MGRRLFPEEVRAQQPIEGYIKISREPSGSLPLGRWKRVAMLMPYPGSALPLAELHAIELVVWDSRGLVLSGVEENWHRKQRRDCRQSWWVRPIDGATLASRRRLGSLEADEEAEQIRDALNPDR